MYVFNWPDNPFDGIDFKSGEVKFIENDFENPKEDMLQVAYHKNFLLDVGWYGASQAYIIYIIKDNNWETPILKTNKHFGQLKEVVTNASEWIEEEIEGNHH